MESPGIVGLLLAILGTLTLQVFATLRVARSSVYKNREKCGQIRFIWAVPLLGACLSLAMLASDHDHPPRDESSSLPRS